MALSIADLGDSLHTMDPRDAVVLSAHRVEFNNLGPNMDAPLSQFNVMHFPDF